MVWDGLKAHVCGLIIKQISNIKTATKEWETLVLSEARTAEEQYITNPSPALERSWLAAQSLHQQVTLTAAENKFCFFTQQKYFEEGENTVHLLAVISRSQQGASYIETIQGPTGNTVQDVAQILDVFSGFFQPLADQPLSLHCGRSARSRELP